MSNTLALVGDGDDVDLVYEFEAVFGVAINDQEAENCQTVGDIHHLVTEKLEANDERRPVCFSAVSFYRLRRAIREITGHQNITPRTRLDLIFPNGRIGPYVKCLQEHTGMVMPSNLMGPITFFLLLLLALGSPIAVILSANWIGYWSFSWLFGWLLIKPLCVAPIGFAPKHCPDVGSFAKAIAGLNHGSLSAEFDVRHPDDVLNALIEVIRDTIGFTDPIDRDTTFFASYD